MTVDVTLPDLRVGDVIVDYTDGNGTWWSSGVGSSKTRWRVTSIDSDYVNLHDELANRPERLVAAYQMSKPTLTTWRVERADESLLRLKPTDLQVGDVIVGYAGGAKGYNFPWTVTELKGDLWLGTIKGGADAGPGGLVARTSSSVYLVRRSTGASAPAASASPWNGKCPKCGRGTYSGFVKMEHEGGACSGGSRG